MKPLLLLLSVSFVDDNMNTLQYHYCNDDREGYKHWECKRQTDMLKTIKASIAVSSTAKEVNLLPLLTAVMAVRVA